MLLLSIALAQVRTQPVALDLWTRGANLIVEGTPECTTQRAPADTGEAPGTPTKTICVFHADRLEVLEGDAKTLTFHQGPPGVLIYTHERDPLDVGVRFRNGEHYMLWLLVSGDRVSLASDQSVLRRTEGEGRTFAVFGVVGAIREAPLGGVEAVDLTATTRRMLPTTDEKERKKAQKELERIGDAETRDALSWEQLRERVRATLGER
ncbi:MAG: hypothetical protein H6737_15380 [Alphaproteobacteria bacterium]|nr:hypothetical protein [Alphaproteobacteria bacterium]